MLLAYAVACGAALIAMIVDKERSVYSGSRVPETTLIWLAVLGWPGAKLAQRLWRHKTRKQPFARNLNLAAIPHLGLWCGIGATVVLKL